MRLGIVGGGIAGLGCAAELYKEHEITVFDRNSYPGGHSNTIEVDEDGRAVAIDTGFMVYNCETYPNLCRLFKALAVESFATDMSFSVQHGPRNIEWCGSSFDQLFGQRRNLFDARFWKFVLELDRFNKQAELDWNTPLIAELNIHEYVRKRGFSRELLDLYLLPMSSAIWSTPPDVMESFPASTLLTFFHNHRFNAGLKGHIQWYTIRGGSKEYVRKLIAPFRDRIKLNAAVARVRTTSTAVEVVCANGESLQFDKVIIAAHADEALAMLDQPDELESNLLENFRYSKSSTLLHTDENVMPATKKCWAAWNYRIEESREKLAPTTHYWMNRLQQVSDNKNYFVSLNADDLIAPDKILRSMVYTHPTFDRQTSLAQKELHRLNEQNRKIHFCGSYFSYGFHEDAYTSALRLGSAFRGEPACVR
jgi:uncharacterized protein